MAEAMSGNPCANTDANAGCNGNGGNTINIAMLDPKAVDKYKQLPPEELRRLRKVHQTALGASQIGPPEALEGDQVIDIRPENVKRLEEPDEPTPDPDADAEWD